MDVHYSSKTVTWETPPDLFQKLNAEHGFTLDVCALPENAKCAKFFTPEVDGLLQDWSHDVCWMNPPYGRGISSWIKKAATCGAKVVCLVPARTDTAWWHDWIIPYGKIEFLRGRLRFSGNKDNAPFPNAIVIFTPTKEPTDAE